MRTCYVIDDESHAISNLQDYIEKTPGLELMGASQNPLEALALFQEGNQYPDITFLDVDMPQISGIELSPMLRGKTLVVFTTAFPNFAIDAFDVEASDFLLKPFSYERFLKCIHKLTPVLQRKTTSSPEAAVAEDHFYIQTEGKGKVSKLFFRDLVYIESQKNYLSIITSQKKLLTYLTLSEIEEKLPSQTFLRIHKSYIINVEKISHVEGNEIFLNDIRESFPIGASYRDTFFNYMKEKLIKTKRSQ